MATCNLQLAVYRPMNKLLNVLYYNTFLPKKMGEGLVSRQFLLAAARLDGWQLTAVPPISPAVLAESNVRERHKHPNGREKNRFLVSVRKSLRRLRSPTSSVPVAPYFYTRRMTGQLTAAIQSGIPLDVLLLHLSQQDLETLARVCRQVEIPIVLRAPGPLAYQADYVLHRYMSQRDRQNEKFLYEVADAILVISQSMKQLFIGEGVAAEKIHVVPNGIDLRLFAPDESKGEDVRRQLGLYGRKVVGYVGGFWPGNDLDTLLKAWQIVEPVEPEATLLLVGYGPGLLPAQKLSKALELKNCVWTGRVDYSQVPRIMAAMDVGIGPYVPEALAFVSPLKVIEYAAVGLPVVATDGGQISELIADGVTGFTYEAGSAGQLADRILHLLAAPEVAQTMGRRARQHIQNWYSWDKVAQNIFSVCCQAAA